MASGFFAVLDDIAALMDDVAVTTKVAATKTAGILGDDLAVNAEKSTGFVSSRELPVLWSITKGSLLNKLIIVPAALLLNAFFPAAIEYALIGGGFYLAYEGVEKILEYFFHHPTEAHPVQKADAPEGIEAERTKVKAAVRTDFMLSIEIVIIALGSVEQQHPVTQVLAVSLTALLATIGVYGIVALIVRMDDAGYQLIRRSQGKGFFNAVGLSLVKGLPVIIKLLAVVGTIALVLVSGGIFVHHIDYLHHLWPNLPGMVKEVAAGLIAGLISVAVVTGGSKIVKLIRA